MMVSFMSLGIACVLSKIKLVIRLLQTHRIGLNIKVFFGLKCKPGNNGQIFGQIICLVRCMCLLI